jgi:hypothetical protein
MSEGPSQQARGSVGPLHLGGGRGEQPHDPGSGRYLLPPSPPPPPNPLPPRRSWRCAT